MGATALGRCFALARSDMTGDHDASSGLQARLIREMPMRIVIATGRLTAALAGCTGHDYEPRKPGISFSGEAGAGVVYRDGEIQPHNETKITVSLGGSI